MEAITIATLVTVIITGVTQIAQLYFDYKRDQHSNSAHIYKVYKSNCCSTIQQDEKD
jgi:hypothetical protein